MILIRKYKSCAAALLIALYAFIAVPVQAWHRHAPVQTSAAQYAIFDDTGMATTGECKVCSHKYSTYNDDCVKDCDSDLMLSSFFAARYLTRCADKAFCRLSNKGPPVFNS